MASLLFAVGDLLIYYGTMMGFACPGCGLRDPGTWLYTMLPWLGGAALLGVAGWSYHRATRQTHQLFSSIAGACALGIGTLFLLFMVFIVIASFRR